MNEALTELAEYINGALPGEVLEWTVAHDELTIVVGAASVDALIANRIPAGDGTWTRCSSVSTARFVISGGPLITKARP